MNLSELSDLALQFWKMWCTNMMEVEALSEENEALKAGGLPSSNPKRQQVWSRLEFLKDHQGRLDQQFPAITFEVV